jgi:hypothetical protein
MVFISDYGGNNRRRPKGRAVDKDTMRSYRCRECGKGRFITKAELARAAAQKCLTCGGTLLETAASLKRNTTKIEDTEHLGLKHFHCEDCDKSFRTRIGLQLHCEDHHAQACETD